MSETTAAVNAGDVILWAWWPPAQDDEPAASWWNDNDKFPSASRSLGGHLARADWKGWRIVAITRDRKKVIITRPDAGRAALEQG